eukprot:TRINITY_DN37719_c0_g1_i1.p1 TRINITY_DN37719_c0_g1~~TRINITY_DN37719_c0_g1_i1.p1  ORF type:complete len:116 (+),score=12.47 TRINITY_DN37719_c0_g1_i1:332-679(+)
MTSNTRSEIHPILVRKLQWPQQLRSEKGLSVVKMGLFGETTEIRIAQDHIYISYDIKYKIGDTPNISQKASMATAAAIRERPISASFLSKLVVKMGLFGETTEIRISIRQKIRIT